MINSNHLEDGELLTDAITVFLDLLNRKPTTLTHSKSKKFFEPNDETHEYAELLIDRDIFD